MKVKDCKYRLPCNWCDKYDRRCEAVLLEIYKQEQDKNVGKPESKECEHDWTLKAFEPTNYTNEIGKRYYNEKYVCTKCGKEEYRMSLA